jgi:ribosomal protein L11 methyltransferase
VAVRRLELSVEADVEAVEPVVEILGRLGQGTAVRPTRLIRDPGDELAAREDVTAPYVISAWIPDDPSASAAIDATERALWHLQAFGLRPVGALKVTAADDVDWTDAWKAGFAAQRIGRMVVVPSWLDEALRPGEVALRLDPGMAFGTGLHPTTRGCLTLLEDLGPMPSRILDVGSGSGILALAALRLGASHAVCLDTDPLAVEATRANAALNGVADAVSVELGTLAERPSEAFPLVLANLVAALHVELADRLAAHTAPGGMLVAGGIIEGRSGDVMSAFEGAGFRLVRRLDDGEWVTLALERRDVT